MRQEQSKAIILMGVTGCGKTTVGRALSKRLDWPFFDGDDFHPTENVKKMAAGIPLTDDDRYPWLVELNKLIAENLAENRSIILACSALKTWYRELLTKGNPGVVFVYLQGDFELIFKRLQSRGSHYMKAGMLESQFAILEEPQDALTVRVDKIPEEIADDLISKLD